MTYKNKTANSEVLQPAVGGIWQTVAVCSGGAAAEVELFGLGGFGWCGRVGFGWVGLR